MSRARTIWKWTAAALAGLALLLAVTVVGLRLWLERSPELGPELVARVQRMTGLEFSFARLDVHLGPYGPELVFRDARVTVPGQRDALVAARAGRVGFDLWRSIRTGRLAAGVEIPPRAPCCRWPCWFFGRQAWPPLVLPHRRPHPRPRPTTTFPTP